MDNQPLVPRLSKHVRRFRRRSQLGKTTAATHTPLRGLLVFICVLVIGTPAMAHLQILHGKLLDLVQRSDLIVIGTAQRVVPIGTRLVDTTISIARVLTGTVTEKQLTFRGPTRFAPGERYVFFLHHTATGFTGEQDSGTVFPCAPADDALYASTVQGLSRALRSDLATRPDAVRAALLPALAAQAPPLRYHAAFELRTLAQTGHPPNAAERIRIEQVQHDPSGDPALQPLLTEILRPTATATAHTPAAE